MSYSSREDAQLILVSRLERLRDLAGSAKNPFFLSTFHDGTVNLCYDQKGIGSIRIPIRDIRAIKITSLGDSGSLHRIQEFFSFSSRWTIRNRDAVISISVIGMETPVTVVIENPYLVEAYLGWLLDLWGSQFDRTT